MLIIRDVLVSRDLIDAQFVCHLERCKGACCVGGDYGAPIADEEVPVLTAEFENIKPFMEQSGVEAIEEHGVYQYFSKPKFKGVTLREDRACAFVRIDPRGVAHCTIEEAWKAGATEFRKPVSCHLYPVRVRTLRGSGMKAANYDKWDLCKAACSHGAKLKVPLYQFVREALIRRFGQEFYDELEAVAKDLRQGTSPE